MGQNLYEKRNKHWEKYRHTKGEKNASWPISRVLSWTVIHLGYASLHSSSNLPELSAGHTDEFLFGLASSGVYHATNCCQSRGALLPHHFNLTGSKLLRRYIFCCTFRRLSPPRRYLALYPAKPGLSSPQRLGGDCLANLRMGILQSDAVIASRNEKKFIRESKSALLSHLLDD